MAPIGNEVNLSDRERLIRIETLVDGMAKSSAKFEATVLDLVQKIEHRQGDLEKAISDHLGEEGTTYRKLKYEIIKYFVLTVIGAVVGAILAASGLFGG